MGGSEKNLQIASPICSGCSPGSTGLYIFITIYLFIVHISSCWLLHLIYSLMAT